jgi:hypothetical protein
MVAGGDWDYWSTPVEVLDVDAYYALWGGRISREIIEEACQSLQEDGADPREWLLGYTDEDIEDNIGRLDHELEMLDKRRSQLSAEADKWLERAG